MQRRNTILFLLLSLLVVALLAIDMMVGSVGISAGEVWAAITGGECDPIKAKIIIDVRLMKAIVAILAGAALAVSGLQMQVWSISVTAWSFRSCRWEAILIRMYSSR